jgi:hypothetical protein
VCSQKSPRGKRGICRVGHARTPHDAMAWQRRPRCASALLCPRGKKEGGKFNNPKPGFFLIPPSFVSRPPLMPSPVPAAFSPSPLSGRPANGSLCLHRRFPLPNHARNGNQQETGVNVLAALLQPLQQHLYCRVRPPRNGGEAEQIAGRIGKRPTRRPPSAGPAALVPYPQRRRRPPSRGCLASEHQIGVADSDEGTAWHETNR